MNKIAQQHSEALVKLRAAMNDKGSLMRGRRQAAVNGAASLCRRLEMPKSLI